jgi:hypothetical protein
MTSAEVLRAFGASMAGDSTRSWWAAVLQIAKTTWPPYLTGAQTLTLVGEEFAKLYFPSSLNTEMATALLRIPARTYTTVQALVQAIRNCELRLGPDYSAMYCAVFKQALPAPLQSRFQALCQQLELSEPNMQKRYLAMCTLAHQLEVADDLHASGSRAAGSGGRAKPSVHFMGDTSADQQREEVNVMRQQHDRKPAKPRQYGQCWICVARGTGQGMPPHAHSACPFAYCQACRAEGHFILDCPQVKAAQQQLGAQRPAAGNA